jgi:hypothetical protein
VTGKQKRQQVVNDLLVRHWLARVRIFCAEQVRVEAVMLTRIAAPRAHEPIDYGP